MYGRRFEWDEAKNRSNQRKHGLSFEEAVYVFNDPCYVAAQDRVVGGEERWQTIGFSNRALLVMVAHIVREEHGQTTIEVIRIISARPANSEERWRYEDENS